MTTIVLVRSEAYEPVDVISNAVVNFGFLAIVMSIFQQLQEAVVHRELEANGHLQFKTTMENLLADMCHAVVELDEHYSITKSCPKLAGLLLKNISSEALKGEGFPDLLSNDGDRERFAEFMSLRSMPAERMEKLDSDEPTSSVYVKLTDSSGAIVSVQLFHSCHHAPAKDVCHIVGIREVQEHDHVVRAAPQQPASSSQGHVETAAPQRATGSTNEETQSVRSSSGASQSTDSGMAVFAPVIAENAVVDPVSAVVNPLTQRIIGISAEFKLLTGPVAFKSRLQNIILNWSEFETWLHRAFYAREDNLETEPFEVELTAGVGRPRPRFEFKAEAYILQACRNVRPSEMGLEDIAAGLDKPVQTLCVLALRRVESYWNPPEDKQRQVKRAAPDNLTPRRYGLTTL